MAIEDGATQDLHLESVDAVENPHIMPSSSRHAGSKRSASGDIDSRPQQRQKMEQSVALDALPGSEVNCERSPSEEIASKNLSNKTMENDCPPRKGSPIAEIDDPEINGEGLPVPDDTAPSAGSFAYDENGKLLSKNQQKKRRKQAEWDAKKPERKVIRKEKLAAKRGRRREARDRGEEPAPSGPKHKPKDQRSQLPVTFLIDCDFDDLMLDHERKSLASQITRSYSDMRKATCFPHLAICSFGGELKTRFTDILTHYKGWKNIRFVEENFVDAAKHAKDWMADNRRNNFEGTFSSLKPETSDSLATLKDRGEVVYLTSESPDTLTTLKPYSTYIIGGLVDKNREKGICYQRAREAGVKTAKLPIGDFMDMTSRKVLATNHVNEIMLNWLECGDWGEAFMQVIPKRKGGKLKDDDGKVDDEEDEADGNVEDGAEGDMVNRPEDAEVDKSERNVEHGVKEAGLTRDTDGKGSVAMTDADDA